MPQASDLTGLGVPPQVASALGNQATAVTCAGTAQTTATAILSHLAELTAASSQTGAILPATALVGTPYYVFSAASTSAVVYVPSGHYLNGSQNAGLTVAQNKGAVLIQYKKNYWTSVLTA